jgi:hypothetical protein
MVKDTRYKIQNRIRYIITDNTTPIKTTTTTTTTTTKTTTTKTTK